VQSFTAQFQEFYILRDSWHRMLGYGFNANEKKALGGDANTACTLAVVSQSQKCSGVCGGAKNFWDRLTTAQTRTGGVLGAVPSAAV